MLILLNVTLLPILFVNFATIWAVVLSKYYSEEIWLRFLSRRLQQPDTRYLKKNLLAATQYELFLATKLIGQNPQKISDKTTELVAQRLVKLIHSVTPSLNQAAAEVAVGISEGKAGSIILKALIQDIYYIYRVEIYGYGNDDDDEQNFSFGMPISGQVLRQQARQKQMPLERVQALLSEMRWLEQKAQTIWKKHQIVQYIYTKCTLKFPFLAFLVVLSVEMLHTMVSTENGNFCMRLVYLARYFLSNIMRFLNNDQGRRWIIEILSYYDAAPPDELVQVISEEVERRSPSKKLLDTVAMGFSTGQISGDIAERFVWGIVAQSDKRQKESIKAIFTAILGPDQPSPDVSRIAILIAIGALDSEKILGYVERGPFPVITSILSPILASERVKEVAFTALEEGLAHHNTNVRQTVIKILDEALQAEPNFNIPQILHVLQKALDSDEYQVRLSAATAIKKAAKANIIGGELIGHLEPLWKAAKDSLEDSLYPTRIVYEIASVHLHLIQRGELPPNQLPPGNSFDGVGEKIQSIYRSCLDRVATPTITLSEGREDSPEEAKKAIALYQKLGSIDKSDSSGRELWQKTLAELASVAKSGYIPRLSHKKPNWNKKSLKDVRAISKRFEGSLEINKASFTK